MSVLFDSNGELRSGCKFAIYIMIFSLFLIATSAFLSAVLDPNLAKTEIGFLGINALGLLIPAVGALLFIIRTIDIIPASVFGVGIHEKWCRDLGLGLLIAAGMALLFTLMGASIASVSLDFPPHEEGFWWNFLIILFILSISAANEEIVFRGYVFQVLIAGIGPWGAMVLMSGLFGLLHHMNPGATWLGTTNTFLAGIVLSIAYLRTRSLWFPFGIHVGWNVAIGPILGYNLSGIQISSIWQTEMSGSDLYTGGNYGPEGGLIGTCVLIIAIAAVLTTRAVDISPTLRRLVLENSSKVYQKDIWGSMLEIRERCKE